MGKRVLVINTVNTGFTGITGIMMNLVRGTCDRVQYDFVLCWHVEPSFLEELEKLGDHVYRPPCSRFKQPMRYLSWLRGVMNSEKYDAVHAHGNSGTLFLEMWAAKKAGVPVRMAHSHSTSCRFKAAHYLLKPLLNRVMTRGIACSEAAGKCLFTENYTVLPNAIDAKQYAFSPEIRLRYRRNLGLENNFVIGHVGYMDTEKNHLFLLEVFREVLRERPEARLLLVGDGRLRPEIEAYIAENDMHEAVLLLGKRADTAQLYQCMDVCVLPSLFEGLPLTLVEAQAAGLPCMVSAAVSREADVTGGMTFITLEKQQWVTALVGAKAATVEGRITRNVHDLQKIKAAKYDIRENAAEVLTLYGGDVYEDRERPEAVR